MNLAFFGLEFFVVSALLLGAYRLKDTFGMNAIVATVASLQFMQAILAASFFWPVTDELFINPGSSVLFAGNLAILLYAYAKDGVLQARTVLYAVLVGNIVPSIVGALVGLHIAAVEPINLLQVPTELFERGILMSLVGILLVYFDQLLAVISFSWFRKKLPRFPIAFHMSVALVLALVFDTVGFLTLVFWGSPILEEMLISGVASKSLGGLAYGIMWGIFLQNTRASEVATPRQVLDILLFQEDLASLREAATTDPMTGLLNRRAYDLMLDDLLDKHGGETFERFAIVLCDADRFKQVNDTLGHTEGDRVLEEVAQTIQGAVREGDFAFRLGGDEFLILLPDAGIEQARDVAARISNFEFDHPELDHAITLTIGISAYPEDGGSRDELFDAADRRLYQGKSHGRNRIVATT